MTENDSNVTPYLFLDGENERQRLIVQIGQVREEVLNHLRSLPEAEWYEPRYHGWSPAAMIAHLNTIDSLSLWHIKLSLMNIKTQFPASMIHSFNDLVAKVFRNRVMATSMKSVPKNEARIADFITHLPMDKFSKQVFEPTSQRILTVEQAIQHYFLHHWQTHLLEMRQAEGITPSQQTDE